MKSDNPTGSTTLDNLLHTGASDQGNRSFFEVVYLFYCLSNTSLWKILLAKTTFYKKALEKEYSEKNWAYLEGGHILGDYSMVNWVTEAH